MRLKQGVKLAGIKPETIMAVLVVDNIYKDHGRPEGVTITSICDGKHMPNSKHYSGEAIDTRTRYFNRSKQKELTQDIKNQLGSEFDVVLERDHIHIEFDPK